MTACQVRLATSADAAALARHRAEMSKDMGELPEDRYQPLRRAAERELLGAS